MLSTKLSTQGFNTAEDISEIFSTETVYNLRQKITASFDYLLSGSLVNNWPIFFLPTPSQRNYTYGYVRKLLIRFPDRKVLRWIAKPNAIDKHLSVLNSLSNIAVVCDLFSHFFFITSLTRVVIISMNFFIYGKTSKIQKEFYTHTRFFTKTKIL